MAKALKTIGTIVAGVGIALVAVTAIATGAGIAALLAAPTILGGVSLGAIIAGGALLATIAGGLSRPPTPNSQTERLFVSINPREPFKRALGHTALATDIRYEEWFGTNQERCRWIVAVASHKIKSVLEIWIEQELAWSAAGGYASKYAGYFTVRNIILEGGASNGVTFGSGNWNDTRRLTGCAFVDLEFKVTGNTSKVDSPFASSLPSRMTIVGEGGMVYDPRRDSTVPGGSGSMRADDQSTWAFNVGGDEIGGNLPLQILAELLGWKINGKLAVGSGLPPKRIDLPSFIVAANIADEMVNRSAGGTEHRYRGAGVLSESDTPDTRLNTMLAACCGRLRDTSGRLSLVLMHNDLATIAADDGLTEDDIVGPFTWNPDPAVDQTPNVGRGKYTDPSSASLYQPVDYPDVELPSTDGIERPMPYDLIWCESPSQAQRCVKQTLQRRQYVRTFESTVDIRAWKYGVGDPLPFTFGPLGFNRVPMRVAALDLRSNPAPITLAAESDDIYAWDADDRAPVVAADPIIYDSANNPLIQAINDVVAGAIGGLLTNESHEVPAAADGTVLSYSGATGDFKAYLGLDDVSASFTLSTPSGGNPQGLTVAYSAQTYTVSGGLDAGEDEATLKIRATGSGAFAGVTIDKVFSLGKSKTGTTGSTGSPGADAKLIFVASDRQTIAYDGAGALSPSTQTTTFTATRQNSTATVNWSITDLEGNALTAATYLSATTGSSVTMTASAFSAAIAVNGSKGVIVTGSITDGVTLSDKISVIKVQAGADGTPGTPGAPGVSALKMIALPNPIAVPCTAGGTPKAGIPSFDVSATQGGSDVTGSLSYGTITSSNMTGVSRSGNTVSASGMTADTGTITVPGSAGGSSDSITVAFSKVKDGPAFVADSATVGDPASTSYVVCGSVTLLMGPGGNVEVDSNGSFSKGSGGGTIDFDAYIEYSVNGGGYTTLGSVSSTPGVGAFSSGDWSFTGSVSGATLGLTSRLPVTFRIQGKRVGSSYLSFGGTLNVAWQG